MNLENKENEKEGYGNSCEVCARDVPLAFATDNKPLRQQYKYRNRGGFSMCNLIIVVLICLFLYFAFKK